ncbi:MAG TPA: hypothetical protein VIV12_28555 [Streptosporangiaceae bacterium]
MKAASPQPGHGRCGGRTRGGAPCRLPAGHGTSHPGWGRCDHHGGATPNHVAAATEAQAKAAAEKFALPIRTTAAQALQDELARSNGVVCWLLARVRELGEADFVWGTSQRVIKNAGPGQGQGTPQVEVTQAARVHPLVSMLERERRHLANVAVEMSRLGLEARVLRLAEREGNLIAEVVRGILSDLHLTPEQQARVPEVVARRLRAVTSA